MRFTKLGQTGMTVSVAGLGTGGHSRVGQRTGRSKEESVALVTAALEHGVNLFDTAERYGTEELLAAAVHGRVRDDVILSTKTAARDDGRLRSQRDIDDALAASLARLNTDYVDIYHLHAVASDDYRYARDVLLPGLAKHRQRGTIRAIGITESFASDPGHRTLQLAVEDACWDVMMVGHNVINQSARSRVLDRAREAGTGVLCMFAVRRALSDPDRLCETLAELARDGYLDEDVDGDPAAWLLADSGAGSLPELAYRFCAHEPGIDSVLFGTGNRAHLDANIEALLAPPLPDTTVARLRKIFGRVTHVSGN